MQKISFSDILPLAVIVVSLTSLDMFVAILVKTASEIQDIATFVFTLLLLITLALIILTYKIWRYILKEESKVETRYKNFLFVIAFITITAGVLSFLTYFMEILLTSGIFGANIYKLDVSSSNNDLGFPYVLMVLTFLTKFLLNFIAIGGCLIAAIVWTRQFRVWSRFSKAPVVRSFFFVGLSMIILFIVQIITISFQFFFYWEQPDLVTPFPEETLHIFMILLLIAMLVLPVYIYFLSVAGMNIRVPHTTLRPKSLKYVLIPLICFSFWLIINFMNIGGDSEVANPLTTLLGNIFLVAAFIPISVGFLFHVKNIESPFLKKNLHLAAVGTLALATFNVVGPVRWTGMNVLPGYLLSFSILTWSLANISQFLGSREALSRRLRDAGDQFLSEIGDADVKAQSVHQMTKLMTDVSNGLMADLSRMAIRIPPTEDEVKRYIVSTMGVKATPSETEVLRYLESALQLISSDKHEI